MLVGIIECWLIQSCWSLWESGPTSGIQSFVSGRRERIFRWRRRNWFSVWTPGLGSTLWDVSDSLGSEERGFFHLLAEGLVLASQP